MIIYKGQRKGTFQTVYDVISNCLSTKKIHLEVKIGPTSNTLIATLKKIFSRCGKKFQYFLNNAKNFIGTNFEKTLHNESSTHIVMNELRTEEINWQFLLQFPNCGRVIGFRSKIF